MDEFAVTCSSCGRERTLEDAYDYNPIQVVTGRPVGWYSGDDGEVCPECMTATLRGGPLPPRRESITCPNCGRTSWNPNDVREGYCGACHDWTTPR